MKTPPQLKETLNKLLHIPFKPYGRSLKGLDCIGLIAYIAKLYQAIPPDSLSARYTKNYYQHPNSETIHYELQRLFVYNPQSIPCDGGIVYFRLNDRTHFGISVAHGDRFLLYHADPYRREVTRELLSPQWLATLQHTYTLKGFF